jgi:hypothetical protein
MAAVIRAGTATRSRTGLAVGLLVAMLLFAACSHGGSSADPEERRGAGSRLPYGFRVPDGAVEAGPMLPCGFDRPFDEATCIHGTAFFAVSRHPEAALNAFLAQGYAMGYHGGVRCRAFRSLATCAGELHQGVNLAPTTPSTVPFEKKFVIVPLPRPPGRAVNVTLQYGVGNQKDVAMMTVQFANQRAANDCEQLPACVRSAPAFTIAAPHVAALPKAGDPLEPALQSDVKVLPGSTIAMHVVDTSLGNPTSFTLLKANDPDATVAKYRTAISHGKWAGPMHDDGDQAVGDGWLLRSWSFGGYDGGPSATVGTLRKGSMTYLALRVTPYA